MDVGGESPGIERPGVKLARYRSKWVDYVPLRWLKAEELNGGAAEGKGAAGERVGVALESGKMPG